jgi:hypothetical protein
VQEPANDKLFILYLRIYRTARDFYRKGRKISRRAGTCPGHVPGKEQSGEPYTFKILSLKMKILKF